MNKIKVLIVDDSEFIRSLFVDMMNDDPELEVVGTAVDPFDARAKIKALNPDVITLDIEMPNMNGIAFLEKIMQLRPMPVVMVSTLTQNGADHTIKALEMGAVDCIGKPLNLNNPESYSTLKEEILTKVKAASRAKVTAIDPVKSSNVLHFSPTAATKDKIIAIGSSTGGVVALKQVIPFLPANCPPVVLVQHILPSFNASFTTSLASISNVKVKEAKDNEMLEHGSVYTSPGGFHLTIIKKLGKYYAKLIDEPKVSGHKPSVDVLFASVAKHAGSSAIGVMLTGMGQDGATSMLEMKQSGAFNIGQNEETCVVYGMPKAAKMKGAIDIELPLKDIAAEILKHCV